MPNFIVIRPFIYVLGSVIDPAQNNPNENTIYGGHNGSMNGVTGHTHSGAVGDGPLLGGGSLNPNANYVFNQLVTINGTLIFGPGGHVGSDIPIWNGFDIIFYSDAGVTETIRLDGATGNITTVGTISAASLTATGLTPGSVVFAGPGGLLSQDNATFFWNTGTKKLGIGTNVVPSDITLSKSVAGGVVNIDIANTELATLQSNAVLNMTGGNLGDAIINFRTISLGAVLQWSFGLDQSDGNALKISRGTALGTNDRVIFSNVGMNLIGTVGLESDYTIRNGNVIDATHLQWALSLRPNNRDFWIYSNNGATQNWLQFNQVGQELDIFGGSAIIFANGELQLPNLASPTAIGRESRRSGAKAWVSFNTAGGILDSWNVSSVTHPSAGNYIVNFTVPFTNANYAFTGITKNPLGGGTYVSQATLGTKTVAACQVQVRFTTSGVVTDPLQTYVVFFGQ